VIFGPSEGIRDTRRPGEDWCIRRSTKLKIGKLVIINLNLVVWVALTLRFNLLGLQNQLVRASNKRLLMTYLFQQFSGTAISDHSIGETQSRGIVLVLES
jgi:hypothetical protein